ncbi:MAG: (4Fe-4S)-binding protein [Bacteroidota bacterium]
MKYKFDQPVNGTIGTEKYQCTIEWRNGKFISDEPASSGGGDKGPDPHSLLLSSIASCTLITLRMYIDRKEWDIPEIVVHSNLYEEIKDDETITTIDRDIIFPAGVDEERKTRLMEIAKHCPVSKILEGKIKVRTFVFRDTETEKKINYANDEITVVWKPEYCQHSIRCWTQLPTVFNPKIKKWIDPDGAGADEIIDQVNKCPSGALRWFRTKEKE